mgnify:CR=1 FL=1
MAKIGFIGMGNMGSAYFKTDFYGYISRKIYYLQQPTKKKWRL